MLKLRFKNNKHNAVWLVEPKVTIGRAHQNDMVIDEAGIAEQHAEIQVAHENLLLKVLSPEHPVKVNETLVTKTAPLAVNDVLSLGQIQLQVVDPKQEPKPAPTLVREQPQPWTLKANHTALANKVFNVKALSVVGRANDCDIVLAAAHLSRRHAELAVRDGLLYVKDLGSANGTYVNGQQISSETRLKRGDEVRFDTLSFNVIGPVDDMDKTSIRPMPLVKPSVAPAPAGPRVANRRPEARPQPAASTAHTPQPALETVPASGGKSSAFTGLTLLLLVAVGVGYWLWQAGYLG